MCIKLFINKDSIHFIGKQKTDFTEFENAYKQLTEKLSPLVYEYGFLLA